MPPPTQKTDHENGALVWSHRPLNATSRSLCVLELVRRVRDNLLHSGKRDQLFFDPERTETLLKHSLTILRACVDASKNVAVAYQDD